MGIPLHDCLLQYEDSLLCEYLYMIVYYHMKIPYYVNTFT